MFISYEEIYCLFQNILCNLSHPFTITCTWAAYSESLTRHQPPVTPPQHHLTWWFKCWAASVVPHQKWRVSILGSRYIIYIRQWCDYYSLIIQNKIKYGLWFSMYVAFIQNDYISKSSNHFRFLFNWYAIDCWCFSCLEIKLNKSLSHYILQSQNLIA